MCLSQEVIERMDEGGRAFLHGDVATLLELDVLGERLTTGAQPLRYLRRLQTGVSTCIILEHYAHSMH